VEHGWELQTLDIEYLEVADSIGLSLMDVYLLQAIETLAYVFGGVHWAENCPRRKWRPPLSHLACALTVQGMC